MIQFFRSLRHRQYVRPWALAAPIIVLVIALPLLRPLRHPTELSMPEATRLAAVQSLVEHHRLASATANLPTIQPDMPVFTLILAGPYWLLFHMGYRLSRDTAMVSYLLTLFCATIPAAATPGLIYRMGRIFGLSRPMRCALALGVVLCSGLICYATVINPYAAAAFLILASASSLIHSGVASRRSSAAIALAGFFAATAVVIDFSAVPFLFLFPVALLAVRAPATWRGGALLFFAIGVFPPLLLHGLLSTDVIIPSSPTDVVMVSRSASAPMDDDEEDVRPSLLAMVGNETGRLFDALLGSHGLLSHFPALILGGWGIASVLHRHWPGRVKAMALLTACGAVTVVIWIAATGPSDPMLMYANRFFIPFSPLLLYWAGAWLRQSHRPAVWGTAGGLIIFSVFVGVLGAINPYPPAGYDRYTPVAAMHHLLGK
jgi:hypothetical protein